jgi:hypothetical protein
MTDHTATAHRLKKGSVKVVKRDDDGEAALDEMADDKGVLSDGGGALDYEQYYPTLLPLLPPEQERAAMNTASSAPATPAQEVCQPSKPSLLNPLPVDGLHMTLCLLGLKGCNPGSCEGTLT